MIISSDECKKCNYICNVKCFQQNFENWTSGNDDIDEFIRNTQLSSHEDLKKVLEWIPYNRFCNIKSITKNMYKANWIDGNMISWNNHNKNWVRKDQNMFVNLKSLSSENITLEFINKVINKFIHS
jgi:hypothetical protein